MTNGYCAGGHAERRAEAAAVEQVEQTRQVARPLPAQSPVPLGRR
ncbi:hypothetical protein [Nonomuraea sp. NPDC052265]